MSLPSFFLTAKPSPTKIPTLVVNMITAVFPHRSNITFLNSRLIMKTENIKRTFRKSNKISLNVRFFFQERTRTVINAAKTLRINAIKIIWWGLRPSVKHTIVKPKRGTDEDKLHIYSILTLVVFHFLILSYSKTFQ